MTTDNATFDEELKEAKEEKFEAVENLKEAKLNKVEDVKNLRKVKCKASPKKKEKLKKLYEKHGAVSFTETINKFAYYAIDVECLRLGKYKELIDRGVMVFSHPEDWYIVLDSQQKLLFGHKLIQGAVLMNKYAKQLAKLIMLTQIAEKGA